MRVKALCPQPWRLLALACLVSAYAPLAQAVSSFAEVQHWLAYSPAQKRAVWQRITREGTAWRFNRYAERAAENVAGNS